MTVKDALKLWVMTFNQEEKHPGQPILEATVIKCMMMQPFVTKMDSSLAVLNKLEYFCLTRQLSLSTNQIEKISNLNGLGIIQITRKSKNIITGKEFDKENRRFGRSCGNFTGTMAILQHD